MQYSDRNWQQMHKRIRTGKFGRIAIAFLIVSMLSACAQTKHVIASMGPSKEASDDAVILGAPDAEQYLSELRDLSYGNPKVQQEIFEDARSESTLTPGPQTDLRYGMILATPGHAGFNPQVAQTLLRDVLLQESILTPAEISLATIHLKSVERQIALSSEARQTIASTSRAATTEGEANRQRLATVEAENRRLREELADAEEKLDAITSIERSIREQDQ